MPTGGNQTASRALSLGDFGYEAPERLIAQEPMPRRDDARLLVRDRQGGLRHRRVVDLTSELAAGTLLILNETKVFPSRLTARLETGGGVELFLVQELTDGVAASHGALWRCLAKPLKKLRVGRRLELDGGLVATVAAQAADGAQATVDVRFAATPAELATWVDRHGFIPLPPYIKRPQPEKAPTSPDRERYQTVFAARRGSVAAPTAGLHFTSELLAALEGRQIEIRPVALHVGAGTFLPVKSESLNEHKMHAETYCVPAATLAALLKARRERRPVVAVGTTSFRCLEDLYRRAGNNPDAMPAFADTWLSTDLFIYPHTREERYRPWVIDGLFTNFHQPYSTLFMLVSALLGLDATKDLYKEAVATEYRLYSYGDASLLWLP